MRVATEVLRWLDGAWAVDRGIFVLNPGELPRKLSAEDDKAVGETTDAASTPAPPEPQPESPTEVERELPAPEEAPTDPEPEPAAHPEPAAGGDSSDAGEPPAEEAPMPAKLGDAGEPPAEEAPMTAYAEPKAEPAAAPAWRREVDEIALVPRELNGPDAEAPPVSGRSAFALPLRRR